jgi:large repetitive protein
VTGGVFEESVMRFTRILVLLAAVAAIAAPAAQAFGFDDGVNPPSGQVGTSYDFTFKGRNGCPPYTFVFQTGQLPPGLSMDSNGHVTGTPTQAGDFSFWLELRDTGCVGGSCPPAGTSCSAPSQRPFTIHIAGRLSVATNSLPDAPINQPYSQQLTATGGTVSSWSVASGALPDGLTLSSSGLVSGTPTKAGTFSFVVQATGSPNNDTKSLSIFVVAPLVLGGPTGAAPPKQPVPVNAKVTTPFSWAIKATGGKEPYTYSSTPLPAGLALSATDGTVTGTPTLVSSKVVTFTVTDALGVKANLNVRLTVQALLAFSVTATPKAGKVAQPYFWKIPVTGASKTRIFLASGDFPPGLSLNEVTGTLTGTPLAGGRFRLKIWVIGDSGTLISKVFTIRITR